MSGRRSARRVHLLWWSKQLATITDILETQLRLLGITAFTQGMQVAAAQTTALGAAVTTVRAGLGALGTVLASGAGRFAIATLAIAESVHAFKDYEIELLRTGSIFTNLGTQIPIAQLQAYAEARQFATGIDEQATTALLGQLKVYGFTLQQIKGLVPVLQDVQAAGKGNAEEIAAGLNKYFRTGTTRALVRVGIDTTRLTGGIEHDLAEIERQLAGKTGGIAAILRDTLGGSLNGLAKDTQTLFARLGDIFAPALTTAINFIDDVIQGWVLLLDKLIALINQLPSWLKTATGHDQEKLNAGAVREGFGQRDSQNLDEIRRNTGQAAAALVAAVFGGTGTVARQTGAFRSLNAAVRRAS